jgi:hypothetical protein
MREGKEKNSVRKEWEKRGKARGGESTKERSWARERKCGHREKQFEKKGRAGSLDSLSLTSHPNRGFLDSHDYPPNSFQNP